MTRNKTFLLLTLLATTVAVPASATKYAGEFLKIPVGARAIGLGGAFAAISDDATAAYWNPAGMVYLPYREVVFQHSEKFGNLLNHDYLGGVLPLGGSEGHKGALGLSIVRLATDDIPVTPRAGALRPGVDFEDNGVDNNPATSDFGQSDGIWEAGERLLLSADDLYLASASDLATMVSYARQRGPHLAYGANLKFVRSSLPDTIAGQHVTSFGAGLDAGLLYMPTDVITLGVTVHDLTTTYLSWSNGTREVVVPTVDTGIAVNFFPAERQSLTLALDLGWGFENRALDSQVSIGRQTLDLSAGGEYWYHNTLALRTGVSNKDLAFGAGVRYRHFGADYAASLHRFFASDDESFPDDTELDTTHLISVGVSW